MDVLVIRQGQRFVWDSDKAAANIVKHGVTFDRALDVFFDPLHDLLHADTEGEARDAAIGRDRERRLLFVVHLVFEDELTRIISARNATAAERKAYENF